MSAAAERMLDLFRPAPHAHGVYELPHNSATDGKGKIKGKPRR